LAVRRAAFTGDEGVAANNRDARLDRAYRCLMSLPSGAWVGPVMSHCGFTDPATFSRAFRRRFGMALRDVPGNRRG
jgi:AraC family transcriptional regulator, positive regulator of tynA and feaB